MRTCVPAYLRTCVPAYLRTCVPAYLRTCVPASLTSARYSTSFSYSKSYHPLACKGQSHAG
ncbi:hypothetical protein [Moraxella ovis]|uniref:hypothetical protein n=1 Tax=Moraxella ovis TaxID=29433 RepID=UPI0011C0209A|nr:hypothetical protein [Moraxella ovis]